jgi:ubiquinone/menaquinone biosynthesis C-methylase UbiE
MVAKEHHPPFGAPPPENYQRFFVPAIGRPLADDLLREAALKPGERVLDVGCGTGVVARLAAEQVGPSGRVAGVDINPGMLAVARSVSPGATDIEWREASAEEIPYPDGTFDVVLCQLSLQFVPDRPKALAEMHRVLVPGGRVLLNLPGPADPLFETLADALGHHVGREAGGFVRAVFSLHEESDIEGLLKGAGFQAIDAHAYTRDLPLPAPRDFLWQYVGSTPLAGAVASASAEARSALEKEVVAGWSKYEDDSGMDYRQRILVASARR